MSPARSLVRFAAPRLVLTMIVAVASSGSAATAAPRESRTLFGNPSTSRLSKKVKLGAAVLAAAAIGVAGVTGMKALLAPPAPTHVVTHQNLVEHVANHSAVSLSNGIFFVDKAGNVFSGGAKPPVFTGQRDTTSLVAYHGQLIAQRKNGDVQVFDGANWASIASHAQSVSTRGDELVVTTDKGAVELLRGPSTGFKIHRSATVSMQAAGKGIVPITTWHNALEDGQLSVTPATGNSSP